MYYTSMSLSDNRDMNEETEELREKLQDTYFDSLYLLTGCICRIQTFSGTFLRTQVIPLSASDAQLY